MGHGDGHAIRERQGEEPLALGPEGREQPFPAMTGDVEKAIAATGGADLVGDGGAGGRIGSEQRRDVDDRQVHGSNSPTSPNGSSRLNCGRVNHRGPSAVMWKWSSSRIPKAPGTTIIGSLEKHMPTSSGVVSPRTR